MKNLYLNFCKLATLVLMIGLSVKFLTIQAQTFPVAAVADNCPDGVDGWIKKDHLSGLTYTFVDSIPAGFEVTQNCMKVGHHDPLYGTGTTVTNTTLFNNPGGPSSAPCTGVGVPDNGCNLEEISHASFRLERSSVEECNDNEYEDNGECVNKTPVCNIQGYENFGGANGVFDPATEIADNELCADDSVDSRAYCHATSSEEVHPYNYLFNPAWVHHLENNGTPLSGHELDFFTWIGDEDCEGFTHVCTDPSAINYVSELSINEVSDQDECDYSQDVPGCTDPLANNYNREATIDDESCTYNQSSPTPSPEVPGYNCPVAQSCSNACGQPARDIPNGSCGYIHCDPTPACGETPVGGVVLGTTTAKPAGQVLGATTEYAATGVAEDFAFSLIGFAGTGLSGLGILMKRHAKASN